MIVTDADGREFYDCLAGAGTLALGHNHPVVIDAIERMLHEKDRCIRWTSLQRLKKNL